MSEDTSDEGTRPKKIEGKADPELRRHVNMNEESKPETSTKLNRTDPDLRKILKKNFKPNTQE